MNPELEDNQIIVLIEKAEPDVASKYVFSSIQTLFKAYSQVSENLKIS